MTLQEAGHERPHAARCHLGKTSGAGRHGLAFASDEVWVDEGGGATARGRGDAFQGDGNALKLTVARAAQLQGQTRSC